MQIQAIKVQRLYLQVAQQLRDLIAAGTFAAGNRLPSERDLAGQFGVSRPTIREAMIALEIARVVEVRSGSGVYVIKKRGALESLSTTPGPGSFEILEARKLIEGEICALAAERISAHQLARLEALLDEMAVEHSEQAISGNADEKFHLLIAEAAGNSALTTTITWLWQLRNGSEISTHFYPGVGPEGNRPLQSDHQAILNALRSRDAEACRTAMSTHLQRVIEHLLQVP